MAVTIPSDLIADVMRLADPVRLHAASQRLGRSTQAAPVSEVGFSDTLDRLNWSARTEAPDKAAAANRSFERMMLRNVFESILPKADSGIYGGGMSSGIWRSMAADHLASVYAQSGGIGIAGSMAEHQTSMSRQPVALHEQWPYFSTPQIRGFAG